MLPWVLLRLVLGTLLRTLAYLVGKVPGQALDEVTGLFGDAAAARADPRRRGAGAGRPQVDTSELRAALPAARCDRAGHRRAGRGQLRRPLRRPSCPRGRHGTAPSSPGPAATTPTSWRSSSSPGSSASPASPGPCSSSSCSSSRSSPAANCSAAARSRAARCCPRPPTSPTCGRATWTAGTPSAPAAPRPRRPTSRSSRCSPPCCSAAPASRSPLLLVCSVPLAGLTAYFASRPLVESRLLRAWASVAYAFLPAATGALAGGRIGTAVLAVLLPLIARAAVAAQRAARSATARGSWRAAWAYALLLTLATAFTPVVWPHRRWSCGLARAASLRRRRHRRLRAALPRAAVGTPLLVLRALVAVPADQPVRLLPGGRPRVRRRLGRPRSICSASAPAAPAPSAGCCSSAWCWPRWPRCCAPSGSWRIRDRLGRRPGRRCSSRSCPTAPPGPGPPPSSTASRCSPPPRSAPRAPRYRVAEQSFGWRQPVAALIAFAAAAGPLLVAAGWMIGGADGPLERRDPVQVPAFVAEESSTRDQARTLVLGQASSTARGRLHARARLRRPPRRRRTGRGRRRGHAARQASSPTSSRAPAPTRPTSSAASPCATSSCTRARPARSAASWTPRPGLTRLSQEDGSALWRVDRQVSRAAIVPGSRRRTRGPIAAGPVEAHTTIPCRRPAGRVLRLADTADEGWQATLDGKPLTRITRRRLGAGLRTARRAAAGWTLTYETPSRHTAGCGPRACSPSCSSSWPCPAAAVTSTTTCRRSRVVPAQPVAGEGRRARRLRAQAEAERPSRPPGTTQFTPDARAAVAPAGAAASRPRSRRSTPVRRSGQHDGVRGHRLRVRHVRPDQYARAPSSTRRAPTSSSRTRRTRTRQASTTRTRTASGDHGLRPDAAVRPGLRRAVRPRAAAVRSRSSSRSRPHGTDRERPDGSQQ